MNHETYEGPSDLSGYHVGIDTGTDDGTAITVFRRPNRFERLLRRLHLSKGTWKWKVVASHYEKPRTAPDSEIES